MKVYENILEKVNILSSQFSLLSDIVFPLKKVNK